MFLKWVKELEGGMGGIMSRQRASFTYSAEHYMVIRSLGRTLYTDRILTTVVIDCV